VVSNTVVRYRMATFPRQEGSGRETAPARVSVKVCETIPALSYESHACNQSFRTLWLVLALDRAVVQRVPRAVIIKCAAGMNRVIAVAGSQTRSNM
jgi:hypothetical protein